MPHVKLSCYPHQLVFVARGQPPYRVVWGSTRVKPVNVNANQLLPTINNSNVTDERMIITALLLTDTKHPINKQALKPKEKEVDWQHWILWIVLVALL